MNEFRSRPPFDENGYAAYETTKKNVKRTPLRWIIPAGILCVVAVIALIIIFRPKDPEKVCKKAIKDAFSDSFGAGDPLIKELGVDAVRKTLESKDFTIDTILAIQSAKAAEGTDLYNLTQIVGMKPEDIPESLGVGITVESRKDEGFHVKLALTLSSIRLVLGRLWGNESEIIISAPRLASESLRANYSELFAGWYDNPAWSLVDEDDRQSTKDDVREFLDRYKIIAILSRFIDGNSPLVYIGQGYDEAMDNLLKKFTFSEAKNASGKRVQEKFHVGGEYILSYGYHAAIDAEEICKRIRAVTGLSADDFKPAPGKETMEALLYITRRGELISISLETEIIVKGKTVPLTCSYVASGELDPQDRFTLSFQTEIDGNPFAIKVSKETVKNAYEVRSRWDGELKMNGSSYAINLQSSYDSSSKQITVNAKTFWDGVSIGTMEAKGEVKPQEEYSMDFRTMKFHDTFSGTDLDLSWKFTVSPKEDDFSTAPPVGSLDINRMSEEEWQAFYEEVKDNLDAYMEYLGDLM
ncbi:MAG: hypothetical protein J5532_05830 [Lachnospiraceae bacterium]|nr:hypothetical protein [Lachnospiraceae bacterium]